MDAPEVTGAGIGTDATTVAAARLVGRVVGGYRLQRVLEVAETSATLLGQHVDAPEQYAAIEILLAPPGTPATELAALRAEFNREAQALFSVQNSHLLGIYALGMDVVTGNPYMVRPYPQDGTLADRLTSGALPLEKAAEYLAQMADALDGAHALGMIHGDPNPKNILFDGGDHLFLTGFGPAIVAVKYVSPERLRGQAASAASDQYSLGAVLYEMVTGVAPFQGATPDIVALQHAHLPPPPPRALRAELPEQAEAVILRALSKDPAARFPSATALFEAFAQGLGGEVAPSDTADTDSDVQPSGTSQPASPSTLDERPHTTAQPSVPAAVPAVAPSPVPSAPVTPTPVTPVPVSRAAESAPRVTRPAPPAAVVPSPAVVRAAAPASSPATTSVPPQPMPAVRSFGASGVLSRPAVVPVTTVPNPVPSSVPSPTPSPSPVAAPTAPTATAATPAQDVEASRPLAVATPSTQVRKYLVPPALIRNMMLAVFALVLGTALIVVVRALGPVELLLVVGVIALFGYCGIVLPGQAARQEQRRAALAAEALTQAAGQQVVAVGAMASGE